MGSGHWIKFLLFTTRKLDIAVWFWCSTVDPMIDGGSKYEEEKGMKASKTRKEFRTEEEEEEDVEGFMMVKVRG